MDGGVLMSLRIVIGRANTDKSKFVMNERKEQLKTNPVGKPIFYIVQEQMTFQQEYSLLNGEVRGSIRAQVVSFSRLVWRVLQETGGSTKQFISTTGMQMMLDRKSTRLNSSHVAISYAVFCLKKQKKLDYKC